MAETPSKDQRVVFDHAVKALFVDLLGPRLTPEQRAGLAKVGVNIDARLDPAYPASVFANALDFVGRELYPSVSIEEARAFLGELQVDAFASTTLGKASFAMLRLIGFRRATRRVTSAFRNANNFVQVEVIEQGPKRLELKINDVTGQPTSFLGIIRAAGRHLAWPAHAVQLGLPDGQGGHSLIIDLES